jgi:polysaccharide biosynthesis/export protein
LVVSRAGVVYVIGDVVEPRGYVVQNSSDYYATRLIAMARGPVRGATLNKARIIRKSATGELQDIPLPLDKIMKSKAPEVQLQSEDILYIPGRHSNLATRSAETILGFASSLALVGATGGL